MRNKNKSSTLSSW